MWCLHSLIAYLSAQVQICLCHDPSIETSCSKLVCFFLSSCWLDRWRPDDVEKEGNQDSTKAIEFLMVAVAPTTEVTFGCGQWVGCTDVVVWNEGTFHLPNELEEDHEDDCKPFWCVEVYH